LTEVPILQGLIGSGMGKGPALALLLAGPALVTSEHVGAAGHHGTPEDCRVCHARRRDGNDQRPDLRRAFLNLKLTTKGTNMKLQILGTGCAKCNALTQATEQAAQALGLPYELEKSPT
jgi:hypothetical protein